MNYLCLQNPFYSLKTCWLTRTGEFITDIISKNWYEQISHLWPLETIFPFHCIIHTFDFCWFTAGLKQFKKQFYNLTYIFVALQNIIKCQFKWTYLFIQGYKQLPSFIRIPGDVGSFATLAKCSSGDQTIRDANAFFTLSITGILLDDKWHPWSWQIS